MTDVKNNRKIGRNVILLGIVSFLTDVSSEIIFPILPMFIAALGGTGIVIGLIRLFGGFAEGVMYSILFMNAFVPLLNRYTRPRIFGERRKG